MVYFINSLSFLRTIFISLPRAGPLLQRADLPAQRLLFVWAQALGQASAGLAAPELSSHGARTWQFPGAWDPPKPRIALDLASPALAGGFLTRGPQGSPVNSLATVEPFFVVTHPACPGYAAVFFIPGFGLLMRFVQNFCSTFMVSVSISPPLFSSCVVLTSRLYYSSIPLKEFV